MRKGWTSQSTAVCLVAHCACCSSRPLLRMNPLYQSEDPVKNVSGVTKGRMMELRQRSKSHAIHHMAREIVTARRQQSAVPVPQHVTQPSVSVRRQQSEAPALRVPKGSVTVLCCQRKARVFQTKQSIKGIRHQREVRVHVSGRCQRRASLLPMSPLALHRQW